MRVLAGLIVLILAGCQCGPNPSPDAGPDSGPDSGRDAGRVDSGTADAGPPDAGIPDAGPSCVAERCDGLDNDCDGVVDLLADGGVLTQPCPLQLGTCQGARVQCVAGRFPPCTPADYGAKFEDFESLCDGLDNDCSGVADVSGWRPIGNGQTSNLTAVSVPAGWYVATNLDGQMFDEQLRPTSSGFPVGRAGATSIAAGAFAGSIHHLFSSASSSYVRLLNLDGTYAIGADGGPSELDLGPGEAGSGSLQSSNDRSTLVVRLGAGFLTLWADGGVRGALTTFPDAGVTSAAPVRADELVLGIPRPAAIEVTIASGELQLGASGPGLGTATPRECVVATNTTAADAGLEDVVLACPDGRRMMAAESLFPGGAALMPFWEADAGTISNVRVLPSYARATAFWSHDQGSRTTVWMSQLNGALQAPVAEIASLPRQVGVVASIRGGYLLHALFDGGQGVRPYGAYVCPP